MAGSSSSLRSSFARRATLSMVALPPPNTATSSGDKEQSSDPLADSALIDWLFYSPLWRAGSKHDMILRRIGQCVQTAHTAQLQMDLIGPQSRQQRSKRANGKKTSGSKKARRAMLANKALLAASAPTSLKINKQSQKSNGTANVSSTKNDQQKRKNSSEKVDSSSSMLLSSTIAVDKPTYAKSNSLSSLSSIEATTTTSTVNNVNLKAKKIEESDENNQKHSTTTITTTTTTTTTIPSSSSSSSSSTIVNNNQSSSSSSNDSKSKLPPLPKAKSAGHVRLAVDDDACKSFDDASVSANDDSSLIDSLVKSENDDNDNVNVNNNSNNNENSSDTEEKQYSKPNRKARQSNTYFYVFVLF